LLVGLSAAPAIANGQDDRPVVADRPRKSSGSETTKSSGSETTFERDLIASAEIEAGVEAMADDVWAWCDKAKAFGRTVTVKVRFADFRQVTRSHNTSPPSTRARAREGTSSASKWTGTRVPRNAGFPPMILPINRSWSAPRVERISWPGRRRCARFEKQSTAGRAAPPESR
jgi:nucleotidyltransferase/DNA polymerase involved in DNA repair